MALFFEFTVWEIVRLKIWFNGLHSLKEVIHVHYQVLDYKFVRERFDANWLIEIGNLRLTAESLSPIDEQCVTPTDSLPAGMSECQARIVVIPSVN
ncbi:hypothetical protein SAMN05216277_1295 [Halolamina pelagica]|uniref:Uncharacterized protein n=1 Tax=Halolamina pelagica TaxID=699431 RepID=A0A1I5WEP7_9EURY|nr:hypothetical protein SAMN05216277_1295 [Halolamina pelagica]